MRIILGLIAVLYGFFGWTQDADTRIVHSDFVFEKGSREVMYGDQVVLRAQPSTSSAALDTLSIAEPIIIVEKTSETMPLNGLNSPWYKVKKGRKMGYILGGFIALDHRIVNDETYLVTMASRDDWDYARCRVVDINGNYFGHEMRLNTGVFHIEAFDNRGLEGIQSMLCIDLYAEACGVDGGQTYLFNDGKQLINAIQLSSVGDGGVFWFDESITFPEDEQGYDDAVLYRREYGESLDDEMERTKTIINTVVLRWKGGAFTPNKEDIEFED